MLIICIIILSFLFLCAHNLPLHISLCMGLWGITLTSWTVDMTCIWGGKKFSVFLIHVLNYSGWNLLFHAFASKFFPLGSLSFKWISCWGGFWGFWVWFFFYYYFFCKTGAAYSNRFYDFGEACHNLVWGMHHAAFRNVSSLFFVGVLLTSDQVMRCLTVVFCP